MPDESCRRCGHELRIKEICEECKSPISFVCLECQYEPDEWIHSYCTTKKNWMVIAA